MQNLKKYISPLIVSGILFFLVSIFSFLSDFREQWDEYDQLILGGILIITAILIITGLVVRAIFKKKKIRLLVDSLLLLMTIIFVLIQYVYV